MNGVIEYKYNMLLTYFKKVLEKGYMPTDEAKLILSLLEPEEGEKDE